MRARTPGISWPAQPNVPIFWDKGTIVTDVEVSVIPVGDFLLASDAVHSLRPEDEP